jgi:hypothetical protein
MTQPRPDDSGARPSGTDIIRLLEAALVPVEPRADLGGELELRLAEVQAAALDELADWELSAMRDPRNWVRPVAAVAVGTAAGAALVVVRMRRGRRQRTGLRGFADQGRRELLETLSTVRARVR